MARALTDPPRDPVQAATEAALFDRLGRFPPATAALLFVVGSLYLATGRAQQRRGLSSLVGVVVDQRAPRVLTAWGAMNGERVDQGELWRLTSSVFLHGGPVHLVLNAVALYALGRLCEAVYGPVRFLWLFVAAGTLGAMLSWVGGTELTVGSSGAIFGLLGAAIVFGWKHRHQLPPDLSGYFRLRLLPWLVLNLVIGWLVPVIDELGHVGGLVGGVVLAMVLGNRVAPGEDSGWLAHLAMAVAAAALVAAAVWGVWTH